MKIDKLNLDGKKDSIEVLDKIFSAKINKQLVSNVLYKTNANYKGRKAKTKQKNEIIGSTAKIYSQKGTGNARHASKKAPIFVGGGVAHGPKGESKYKIRTMQNIEIIKSDKDNNLLYLKGSIPGAKNAEVVIKKAVKNLSKLTMSEKIEQIEKMKKSADKKKK